MKRKFLRTCSSCMLVLFVMTALCIISAQSVIRDSFSFDGKSFEIMGESYYLDEAFLNGFYNVLYFNKNLVGSFMWNGIMKKTAFVADTIISGVKIYGAFCSALLSG